MELLIIFIVFLLIGYKTGFLDFLRKTRGYKATEYAKQTHKSRLSLFFDKGALGEYLIFNEFERKLNRVHRWLFNVYLPREDGTTTEIDLILLDSSGAYVFESKNYQGWIFGSDTQKEWTQCLKSYLGKGSKKFYFQNPFRQNYLHLCCLKSFLDTIGIDIPLHSIVVFGNSCTLKKVTVQNPQNHLCKLKDVYRITEQIFTSSRKSYVSEMDLISRRMYCKTQTSDYQKRQHIMEIFKKKNN